MKLIDITLPEAQEGTEAVVLGWLKPVGALVQAHEPVLEISTDKVTMEVAAPATGVLQEQCVAENQEVQPGDVLGRIALGAVAADTAPAPTQPSTPETAPLPSASPDEAPDLRRRLSPLVKRMLQTHDLDPAQISGTGRGGRITHKDVQAFLEADAPAAAPPTPAPTGTSRRVPHTPMRRRIANHMVESLLQTAPHVTAVFDADLSAVMAHRAKHKPLFAAKNVRLTYTAYFVYATLQALHAVPAVNSRWHEDALEIFDDFNIGIATALGDEGLIVPVLKGAQNLGLFGIATHLQELTARAREGRLGQADVQGGTFTITNHGVSGSLIATPIINQPQSAILGIGKLEKRVQVVEENGFDSLQIRPKMYVTLTIDHRALDGFQANAFLSRFVEVLETWS